MITDRLAAPVFERDLKVHSEVECRFAMGDPWGIRIDQPLEPRFYLVARGSGWFHADHATYPVAFEPGDMILAGSGSGHEFKSAPNNPVICLDGVLASRSSRGGNVKCGGGGKPTSIVSGTIELQLNGSSTVATGLPASLHIPSRNWPEEWQLAVDNIDTALASRTPASELIVGDIVGAVLTRLFDAERRSAIDAKDLRIIEAMSAVGVEPAESWSVRDLAGRAAMSRSRFTSRFREVAGLPPMQFVQSCRMKLAAGLLTTSPAKLSYVAEKTGYDSDVALSKAFKRFHGMAPGAYRRSRKELV